MTLSVETRRPDEATVPPSAGPGQDGATVRFEGLSKTYGSGDVAVHALRGLDLGIDAGQFVVVLGPSGSGKTTLMNIVGGIETPTEGRLIVGDRDLGGLDDEALTTYRREDVGFVFQFFNLVPTLTALENVALVAELVGRGEAEAMDALDAVGLGDRVGHFTSALSGGEQQRVAIARALVKSPKILLCDEPTGSLDAEVGRSVLGVIHRLARSDGRTVLLATHNTVIATMADRVLRLRSGEIADDVVQPHPKRPEEVTW
jgi:putative ABC transport system ATP-binding protein